MLRSYIKLLKYEKHDFCHEPIIREHAEKLKHIVIVPIYTEPYDVIEENILSLIHTTYCYKQNITILLATESRAEDAENHAKRIIREYGNHELNIVNIVHPEDLPNE